MPDPSLLDHLGINLKTAVAGFAGSTVYIFAFRKTERMQIIGSLVVGTLVAIYVSDYVALKVGTPEGITGFVLGFGGMVLTKTAMAALKKWNPTIPGISSGS